MASIPDLLFKALADPTRRALFERLCLDGEATVGALTAGAGISQPAVPNISAYSSRRDSCATGTKAARRITARSNARSRRSSTGPGA